MLKDLMLLRFVLRAKYFVRSAQLWSWWAAFAILLASAGCRPAAELPAAASSASTTSGEKSLVHADAKVLNDTIARHKGNVVLVDFWATWCEPCVAAFPHTVELAKEHRAAGLATIAVSFDLLEDEAKVRRFLDQQGVDFETLISKYDGVNQKAATDFDVEALPQYRLYDRQGKLRQKWEGKPDDLDQVIEKLLAEPA